MPTAIIARRIGASFVLGLFLLVNLAAPARAIIPAAGIVGGVVVRGITGQLLRKAGVTGVQSGASALSASGLFGVSAAAYIVLCGQNYVAGNDCSGTPLAKLRPGGDTGSEGETLASGQIAATVTNHGTAPTGYTLSGAAATNVCGASSCWYSTMTALCTAAGPHLSATYAGQSGWAPYSGNRCISTGQVVSYFSAGTAAGCPAGQTLSGGQCVSYSCPSGYTLAGTVCNPNGTVWVADGVPTYKNSGGVWIAHPNDPDTAPAISNPSISDAVQPDGTPIKVKVEALPDGAIKVTTYGQGTSNGATSTTVNEFRVSNTGTPTAVTNIFYGDTNTVYNNSASTVNTPAPAPVEIPTDYQRDATGQQTNTKLQTIITDGVKIKEEGTPATEALDAGKTAYNDAAKAREDALPNVTSPTGKNTSWTFSLAFPTGCSPLNVDMRVGSIGRIVTLDPCQYQSTIHELVSMLWAGATLFVVVGMFGRTLREA